MAARKVARRKSHRILQNTVLQKIAQRVRQLKRQLELETMNEMSPLLDESNTQQLNRAHAQIK